MGVREKVRSWSCQPRLSFLVASRAELVGLRGEFLGHLIPAYARWCLLSLSSWCRSFACGDPGRLSGLNNARLVDAGVLVCWHDCLFLWVDAQDVISELFLGELILKEWIIGEANITWFQLSL